MRYLFYPFVCCLPLTVTLFTGCSQLKNGSEPPEVTPVDVSGLITMDGKPLEGAAVYFTPTAGSSPSNQGAVGTTDASGRYQLSSLRGESLEPGASPGKYRVLISRMLTPQGTVYIPDPLRPPADSGALESIPEKYSDHALTELTAVVSGGSSCIIDFKLTAPKTTSTKFDSP